VSKQIETQPAAVPDGLHWGKYIKPYLLYFIAGPILMIVEVLGEVLMPRFLAYIIDYGVSGEAENAPAFIRWLYDLCGRMTSDSDNVPFIAAIAVAMILTAILMMIGGVGGAYFGSKASVNFAADLRAARCEHSLVLPRNANAPKPSRFRCRIALGVNDGIALIQTFRHVAIGVDFERRTHAHGNVLRLVVPHDFVERRAAHFAPSYRLRDQFGKPQFFSRRVQNRSAELCRVDVGFVRAERQRDRSRSYSV